MASGATLVLRSLAGRCAPHRHPAAACFNGAAAARRAAAVAVSTRSLATAFSRDKPHVNIGTAPLLMMLLCD
jgi:hypothetical protein